MKQPRVRDKSPDVDSRVIFTPKVLPPYLKRTEAIEELIPWLYLKGVSTGDFSEALQALVGEQAKGLSANVVVRLKEQWTVEFEEWSQRNLSGEQYVYVWADGIHVNVRLEDDANKKQCILVLMGATADGRKELIALQDGYRESEQCWKELLLDAKQRGLTIEPKLAVGDGALGFWAALRKVFPATTEQRCWFHKSGNVLSKMPKSVQPRAKSDLHEIWQAETRESAETAFGNFLEKYDAKYSAACECLRKDREVLLTFYDFPAQHWAHLRTTTQLNPPSRQFACDTAEQGKRLTPDKPRHDVQTGPIRLKQMEKTPRPPTHHSRHQQSPNQRRNHPGKRRLIQILRTQQLTISLPPLHTFVVGVGDVLIDLLPQSNFSLQCSAFAILIPIPSLALEELVPVFRSRIGMLSVVGVNVNGRTDESVTVHCSI